MENVIEPLCEGARADSEHGGAFTQEKLLPLLGLPAAIGQLPESAQAACKREINLKDCFQH
eukprot:2430469-Amphidinium_carterae.1